MNYSKLATVEIIKKTTEALNKNGIETLVVKSGRDALEKIKELIPKNVPVMSGASRTLEQIGLTEYMKSGQHGWKNLRGEILEEKDPVKQMALRKKAVLADYYIGSVNGLTENGEFIMASNTGSQLPSVVFTSTNLIFVVSTKKIVLTLDEAMKRVEEHVLPLEDENIMKRFNIHTMLAKMVIFKRENPMMGRKVRLILVEEDLGF